MRKRIVNVFEELNSLYIPKKFPTANSILCQQDIVFAKNDSRQYDSTYLESLFVALKQWFVNPTGKNTC